MQEVYKAIGRVEASDVSVLLRARSATGKEVVARALTNTDRQRRETLRGHLGRRRSRHTTASIGAELFRPREGSRKARKGSGGLVPKHYEDGKRSPIGFFYTRSANDRQKLEG